MRASLAIFRMRFIHSLQYRAAAWAGVSTQVFWGFMEVLLYKAFYEGSAAAFPMTFTQITSYIWLRQAFFALFLLWSVDADILEMIKDGNVAYEIIRPADLYSLWFFRNLGSRLSKAALRCGPIFVIGFLLPKPYGLSLPPDLAAAAGFLISFAMACFLIIGMCMWIYVLTFYTVASKGVQNIVGSIADFLAGSLIPIPLMPAAVQKVLYWLPFASSQSLPYLIYNGYFRGPEVWFQLARQFVWMVLVIGSGYLMMQKALRRVIIQGG